MFSNLYKGHNFIKITNYIELSKLINSADENLSKELERFTYFGYDSYCLFICTTCNIKLATSYTKEYLMYIFKKRWALLSQNEILSCDEYIIKNIIE